MPNTDVTTFDARLTARARQADTLLCVGLDPARGRMPAGIPDTAAGAAELCRRVIDATADLALAYKPNLAFFLAFGREGLDALYTVRASIPAEVPVILDCKVGDIDSTFPGLEISRIGYGEDAASESAEMLDVWMRRRR